MYKLQFKPFDKTPKYKQIVQSVITDIERGVLKREDQLPSISELSAEYYLARDTVERPTGSCGPAGSSSRCRAKATTCRPPTPVN